MPLARLKKGRYRSRRSPVPTHLLHGDADPAIRADILVGYEPYADQMRVEERPELVIERARTLFGSA